MVEWGQLCLTDLERHRDEINALNVFPVADADTGTNLLATMRAAVTAAEDALDSAARSRRDADADVRGEVAVGGEMRHDDAARGCGDDAAIGDDARQDDSSGIAKGSVGRRDERSGDTSRRAVGGDRFGDDADHVGVSGDDIGHGDVSSGGARVGDVSPHAERDVDADRGGPADAGTVLAAMARAGTAGARGNSGIILSQVLRGLAEAVRGGALTAEKLRGALRRAAVLVRAALSRPVEGTMLSVLEAAADRAAECPETGLGEVARAAADGACKALGDTPSQLGVLRAAGVVDAGARGLLVVLDALVVVSTGQVPVRQVYRSSGDSGSSAWRVGWSGETVESAVRQGDRLHDGPESAARWGRDAGPESVGRHGEWLDNASESLVRQEYPSIASDNFAESSGRQEHWAGDSAGESGIVVRHEHSVVGDPEVPQYEVMYVLTGATGARIDELREQLARLGDSVVVVGDGADGWSAHVHCADAGAAVEAGLAAGTLSRIRIEGLTVDPLVAQGAPDRGILAVAAGAGAARLFEDSGASVLDGEVTADALLAAIRRMPQREVLVLPNGALAAHELVAVGMAARNGVVPRDVLMLPSGSMVQGLAALAVHDGGRIAVDDAFAMSEAAAGTRWGALRIAPERALTIVGTCDRGDGLGLVGNDVVVIDPDPRVAARTLLDRMLGLGGELVTLLLGAAAPDDLGGELADHITATFPGVEVVAYAGGQPVDLVQIGVE
ncbi:DAK2 domain-containing protein [Nocardia macrotermitis]|nr:DAK2 domain-containing protein [Nocardia macrotermitis]